MPCLSWRYVNELAILPRRYFYLTPACVSTFKRRRKKEPLSACRAVRRKWRARGGSDVEKEHGGARSNRGARLVVCPSLSRFAGLSRARVLSSRLFQGAEGTSQIYVRLTTKWRSLEELHTSLCILSGFTCLCNLSLQSPRDRLRGSRNQCVVIRSPGRTEIVYFVPNERQRTQGTRALPQRAGARALYVSCDGPVLRGSAPEV